LNGFDELDDALDLLGVDHAEALIDERARAADA
jgi:hypothetical protein